MASLDSLPADQRAVLQLVLQRGRTYDDIAGMLSIDRAGVRERALSAFDALGPQTGVPAERRALITDYLLGQLPSRVAESTRDRLAESPAERAWARVIASELSPLAANPLPEIPVEAPASAPVPPDDIDAGPGRIGFAAADEDEAPLGGQRRRGLRRRRRVPTATSPPPPPPPPQRTSEPAAAAEPPPRAPLIDPRKPSSRRGGAVLLIAGGLVVVIVVIIIIASGGSPKKNNDTSTVASSTSSSATTSATTSVSTTSSATPIAQIKLSSPTTGSKTAGVAIVVKQGTSTGIVITAQSVTPNTKHNAYAVWLYSSPTSSHILGFVNPGVGKNGKLQTAGGLPTNAGQYKQLLVTLETQANPKQPGTIVLQGTLTGLS